jgi:hypothetical protein
MEFYNYPLNKRISPFDAVEADNYFAVAGKVSYLGTYEEIGNIVSPFDERNNILSGSYVLCIYKRYSLIENGKVTFINNKFNDGHGRGASRFNSNNYIIFTDALHKYKIDSWGPKLLESYSIQNTDGTYNCSLQPRLFISPDLAIQFAINISNNENMKCIIAQWFADIDRH